jgi:hypothetical protein
MQFVDLLEEGNLAKILDPQVMEDGGKEVKEVAALAALCIRLQGENRPTMRYVEMALEALNDSKKLCDSRLEKDDDKYVAPSYASTNARTNLDEDSRRYSLEEEFLFSGRYPR